MLHLISTLNPAAGGPAEAVRLLLQNASQYTGEVLTLDSPDAPYLTCTFPVHALGPVRTKFGYTPRLRQWLRTHGHRFDAAVVHGLWNYAGRAVRREFAGNKPYFIFPHGMLDPYFKYRHPVKHMKKWAYWMLVERHVLQRASRVLFTSELEARLAEQSFASSRWNPLVVPYGAGSPPAPSRKVQQALAAVCPSLAGHRYLLHLGRIHPKKGCDMLVRAFAKAAATDTTLHLVMAGPDQTGWTVTLRRMAAELGVADRIHWPGLVTGDAKWGLLHGAEAFVLPSHQENFGIAVAEALGCGKPVLLSTEVNIAHDIVSDGAGLVEPDTQAGTDQLLRRWLALSATRKVAMGAQASRTFTLRYCMDRAGQTILEHVEQWQPAGQLVRGTRPRARVGAMLPAHTAAPAGRTA